MAITNRYKRVPCVDIKIDREKRQRKIIDTKDLKDSIAQRGVLNPIIVDKDLNLIAGERRLMSSIELGIEDIPVRFYESLSPEEAQIIELEENLKRSDLSWRDNVEAVAAIHSLYTAREEKWTQKQTAESLAIHPAYVAQILRVSRKLDQPRIREATSLQGAINIINRFEERLIGDAMSDIHENTAALFAPKPQAPARDLELSIEDLALPPSPEGDPKPPQAPALKTPNAVPIFLEDFALWAPSYKGPKFNFVHCDFPYGIGLDSGGSQTGKNSMTLYKDDEEVYWALLKVFCTNLDNFMAHSAHLMFWYSMHFHQETLDFFAKNAPSLVFNPFPLIWLKSDNMGLLPDPKRGPRRIYETALIASREDRQIVKAKSNAYSAPTDKLYHPSTKPEPVLKYFFEMFVDSGTSILDPTCGGGSALRAAEALGAQRMVGLEREKEHFDNAVSAYRKFRILRNA
jgi:ParB/RepB/Spo0J family partition protein